MPNFMMRTPKNCQKLVCIIFFALPPYISPHREVQLTITAARPQLRLLICLNLSYLNTKCTPKFFCLCFQKCIGIIEK